MKLIDICTFTFLLLFICACTAQQVLPFTNKCEAKTVYYCADVNDFIIRSLRENNIPKMRFLNSGAVIDTKRNGQVDEKKFRSYLEKNRTVFQKDDMFVIDWETQFIGLVGAKKTNKNINDFASKVKAIITIGKEYFPDSKWGVYNLPMCNYWKRDSIWTKENKDLLPVLKHCDVLFPSVYDFYRDDNKYAGKRRDSLYIVGNLELTFQINEQLNLPIYPFVWHRYHTSNSIRPLEAIGPLEFKRHMDIINNYSYKGRRVNGLVWWASDRYFSNVNHKSIVAERKNYSNIEDFLNSTYSNYMTIIMKSVNESCLKK